MPRKNLGKTKTIKNRLVYIYLPTIEMVIDWKRRAKEAGQSLSKFVIERVEDSLHREEDDESHLARLELIKRVESLDREIKTLREENKMLRMLVENLDKELKRYRAKPFTEGEYMGIREFDKDLIHLLKTRKVVRIGEILEYLNVRPEDSELVNAINRQLTALEAYGLIQYRGRRWRWIG